MDARFARIVQVVAFINPNHRFPTQATDRVVGGKDMLGVFKWRVGYSVARLGTEDLRSRCAAVIE